MIRKLFIFKLLPILVLPLSAVRAETLTSSDLVLLYNAKSKESENLAFYYAEQRGIVKSQILGVEMPLKARISREEFNQIKLAFTKGLKKTTGSKSAYLTFYDVPYGINKEGSEDNFASFDSELAAPAGKPIKSYTPSNYFNKNLFLKNYRKLSSKAEIITPVCRIDGPSMEICKRIITDAIETEKTGLWGTVYLDKAFKGKTYELGDNFLTNIEKINWASGIPTVMENTKITFSTGYPMKEAACYFGWYARHANGPFVNKEVKFRRGAIAAHIHSYSGSNIRNEKAEWVGPLLSQGAAVTLGNVHEPSLGLTTHFDIFYARLLAGYTVAEAAYMATPITSWQTVVIGDPLYRPFKYLIKGGGKVAKKDKIFRAANVIWKLETDSEKRVSRLIDAGKKLKDFRLIEYAGLYSKSLDQLDAANQHFALAESQSEVPVVKLRNTLHRAILYNERDEKKQSLDILSKASKDYQYSPYIQSVKSLLLQATPASP